MSELGQITRSFDKSLELVRQKFVARLETQVADLDELMWRIEDNPADAPSIDAATNIVHKIAGVAPTLGLTEIGTLAREAESALMALGRGPSAANLTGTTAAVERLSEQLDQI